MIRKLKNSDLEEVINIWLEASIKAHDFVDSEFWKSNMDDMKNLYIPNSETYVYEDDNIIKGFFSLSQNTLAALFVKPEFQGHGIGQKLLNKAKSLKSKLELSVYKENVRSVLFYQKNGFETVEERLDIHTGHKEYLMSYEA